MAVHWEITSRNLRERRHYGVAIYGVDCIQAGKNRVAITYIDNLGGPSQGMHLEKWDTWHDVCDRIQKITSLSIYWTSKS